MLIFVYEQTRIASRKLGGIKMEQWKELLAKGYSDIKGLRSIFQLTESEVQGLSQIQESFPMFINPYYLSLIDLSDPNDPIRKMSIPSLYEAFRKGSLDTSGELKNTVFPGLQHKYKETALILSTNQCAMYCRHCFRKRLVGASESEIIRQLNDITSYIKEHKEITNVLISGGDAFMNSNATIERYLEALCDIPHLDLIRFGTRVPVVLPQRITSDKELQHILQHYSLVKRLYVVTQFNHPTEVTPEAEAAVDLLISQGIPVKNQTVLLNGVNDSARVMGELLKELTSIGVIPYYVFQCRPVAGVKEQFQVPLRTGSEIVRQTMEMQSGMGKCFRYVMSHVSGKIEILGSINKKEMLFKYHQAQDPCDSGRIFTRSVSSGQCWL